MANRKPIEWTREGECIVVTSHKPDGSGYISLCRGGRLVALHRLVCERTLGPMPSRIAFQAIHSCDNRRCVNPRHVRWAAPRVNVHEMYERERGRGHGGKPLLGKREILAIRKASGTHQAIAERFELSRSAVTRIRNRTRWNMVKGGAK